MLRMRHVIGAAAAACVVTAGLGLVAPAAGDTVRPLQREADSLARKLLAMLRHPAESERGVRVTPVTEGELNSFLRLSLAYRIPEGIRDPTLALVGDGLVTGTAIVDLDAVRRAAPPDALDARQWLGGSLPVEVRGRLEGEDGVARFVVTSAAASGLPIPPALLQAIVAHYSRSPEFPSGIDLSAPFHLPAGIREIHVNARQAIVVQN